MEDDWDLHAVVRGCTATTSSGSSNNFPSTTHNNDDPLFSFQDLVDKPRILLNTNTTELHQLCKPFITHQTLLSPISVLEDLPAPSQKQQQHDVHQLSNMKLIQHKKPLTCTLHPQTPRNKRRKNQLKKVCQVAADGLSSDMWSWRKYGQKPIKGSPYPRGYYKCSTSKGCLARKQVERNRSDPNVFIVTYTGEHNHPMPTHRNSLAGIARQKTTKPTTSSPATENEEISMDEKEDIFEDDDDELFGLDKMEPDDDFFDVLDELEIPATGDSLLEKFPPTLQLPWLVNNAATTAAGGG